MKKQNPKRSQQKRKPRSRNIAQSFLRDMLVQYRSIEGAINVPKLFGLLAVVTNEERAPIIRMVAASDLCARLAEYARVIRDEEDSVNGK